MPIIEASRLGSLDVGWRTQWILRSAAVRLVTLTVGFVLFSPVERPFMNAVSGPTYGVNSHFDQ
jgi:hypothetical protein